MKCNLSLFFYSLYGLEHGPRPREEYFVKIPCGYAVSYFTASHALMDAILPECHGSEEQVTWNTY